MPQGGVGKHSCPTGVVLAGAYEEELNFRPQSRGNYAVQVGPLLSHTLASFIGEQQGAKQPPPPGPVHYIPQQGDCLQSKH